MTPEPQHVGAAAADALRRIAVARNFSTAGKDAVIGSYRVRAVDGPTPFEVIHAPTRTLVAAMLSANDALSYAERLARLHVDPTPFVPHLRVVRASRADTNERACVDCGDVLIKHHARGRWPERCDTCKGARLRGRDRTKKERKRAGSPA
jgi:hypothetical protein